MGYGNRPKMPNNNYQQGGNKANNFKRNNDVKNNSKKHNNDNHEFGKSKNNVYQTKTKNNSKYCGKNDYSFKDEEDIYSPKVYAKKPKEKSMLVDIIIPEYEIEKQRMRNKRENDKKYKNKDRGRY